MIAVDTTVIVAAFSSWHEHHDVAVSALPAGVEAPAHCCAEAYSTLTRLPEPFRAPGDVVAEYLEAEFGGRILMPKKATLQRLPRRLAQLGLTGGATYDALVAVTVRDHAGILRSLDRRAEPVYRALGVNYELIS